jgi:hypothetical protein
VLRRARLGVPVDPVVSGECGQEHDLRRDWTRFFWVKWPACLRVIVRLLESGSRFGVRPDRYSYDSLLRPELELCDERGLLRARSLYRGDRFDRPWHLAFLAVEVSVGDRPNISVHRSGCWRKMTRSSVWSRKSVWKS